MRSNASALWRKADLVSRFSVSALRFLCPVWAQGQRTKIYTPRNIEQLSPITGDGVTAAVFQDRGIKRWAREKGGYIYIREAETYGGWTKGEDMTRRVPVERPRRAEKTSMLHLRGEYSRVTLHRGRASERVERPTADGRGGEGGWRTPERDGRGNGGWEREGCDTGSLLAAISSYAPAPIYPPALRISRHDSLRLSRSSTPSAPSPPLSLAILYRTNDNVFGIYRRQPLMSRYSYISADTNARFAIVRVKNRNGRFEGIYFPRASYARYPCNVEIVGIFKNIFLRIINAENWYL